MDSSNGGVGRLILRFGPAVVILLGFGLVLFSGQLHRLSLDGLRESHAQLKAMAAAQPALALAAYVALYIAVIALCLPGGAVAMTLTGGLLFGPWIGGAAAAVGCTLGAMAAYGVCRLAVGEDLDRRASPRMRAFEQGFREDAFFYVLSVRLIPVSPFWFVNLAAALLGAPPLPFLAATFLGIAPASLIYAGLGSDLNRLFDQGAKIGPDLLLAPRVYLPLGGLAVLAALPIAWHRWGPRKASKS